MIEDDLDLQIRVNTKLMYTQTKFNLLAEESEGYAKVVSISCLTFLASFRATASNWIIEIIWCWLTWI